MLAERTNAPAKGTGAQSGEKGAAPVPVLWNERGPFLCLILSLTHRSSSVAMGRSRGRDMLLTARTDTISYDDDMRKETPDEPETHRAAKCSSP
jgi:hypothetical protein